MRQQRCHLDSFAGSILSTGQQQRGDFFRTLSRLPRPSLRRHIVSLLPLGMLHPHPSTKPDRFVC